MLNRCPTVGCTLVAPPPPHPHTHHQVLKFCTVAFAAIWAQLTSKGWTEVRPPNPVGLLRTNKEKKKINSG